MRRSRTTVILALCGAAAVAAPAYAAGGGGPTSPVGSVPTRSRAPLTTPPSYSPPADAPDAVTATPNVRITPSSYFDVSLDPSGKKRLDKTWPDAGKVFTKGELVQVLPGLTSVTVSSCKHASLPGGRTSAHNGSCVLTLHLKGEPAGDPSRLVVNVRGFGTAQQAGQRWDRELTSQRARARTRPGLYTFYKSHDMGVTSAYTDGTITRVLLTKGPVTGQIWFSGIGFTKLAGDYLASRAAYRHTIVPELITLLGEKMHGHR